MCSRPNSGPPHRRRDQWRSRLLERVENLAEKECARPKSRILDRTLRGESKVLTVVKVNHEGEVQNSTRHSSDVDKVAAKYVIRGCIPCGGIAFRIQHLWCNLHVSVKPADLWSPGCRDTDKPGRFTQDVGGGDLG